MFEAEVVRVQRVFGFILNTALNEEFFVRGKDLIGAIPGDKVLARILPDRDNGGENRRAEIVKVISESENTLTGTIVSVENGLFLLPDSFSAEPLKIFSRNEKKINRGDKVKFKIYRRAKRHNEHVAKIVAIYGNADSARVSTMAYLDQKNIPTAFSPEVLSEAKTIQNRGINEKETNARLDLRNAVIFTIDGEDTKDIDDAISIEKSEVGYRLGVHIADVSHYVKPGSELEKEALRRGNSVYIADLVMPMLPKELSNGICSLNQGEDRLAFSCLMEISGQGELLSFEFKKTVIKSLLKGVYGEINEILNGAAEQIVVEKYSGILEQIKLAARLASKLKSNRESRGAPMLVTEESKIICCPDGRCRDIKRRESGIAESVVEELMMMANTAAARLAIQNKLPFLYRVHEPPTSEKLETLSDALSFLGVNDIEINAQSKAADLAAVLKKVKGGNKQSVINTLILRTMMKARYCDEPLGHYGLSVGEYAHFTSPIRRYPDLFIHRIISNHINKTDKEKISRRYGKSAVSAAVHSSATEISAFFAERDCEKYYMAEYMSDKKGLEFSGIISGVTSNGLFVKLDNTVEGRIESIVLPPDEYTVEHNISLSGKSGKNRYTIGDKIQVKCVAANVVSGVVEFILIN